MKKNYVWGIALSMFVAACQQEQISEQGTVENTTIRIQANISDNQTSRTATQATGETTFETNDQIGFFMPEASSPTLFTYNTSQWESETRLDWPDLTKPDK